MLPPNTVVITSLSLPLPSLPLSLFSPSLSLSLPSSPLPPSLCPSPSLPLSLPLPSYPIQAKDTVTVTHQDAEQLRVTKMDFEHALLYDLKPAFGISDEQLDSYVYNGNENPL